MTVGENIKKQIRRIRREYKQPRKAIIRWMKRNSPWYQELVAKEWERQTGQYWENIFWSANKIVEK